MDDTMSNVCGLSIDDVDANRLIIVDDTLSQAAGGLVNDEVEGNGFLLVGEEENLNEGTLVSADNEEGCSGSLQTPTKDNGRSNVAQKPVKKQQFHSEAAAYDFYNVYGLSTGFGVRKCRTSKSKKTGKVIFRRFVCDKEGERYPKDKRLEGREGEVKRRRTVREGCKAKMDIKFRDGMWEVSTFVEDHCHDLTSPPKRHLHRSHNNFHKNAACKNLVNVLNKSGLGPSGIARTINISRDGSGSAVTTNQVVTHLRSERANNMGREAVEVALRLQQKRSEDPNFHFCMELDISGNLRSMFWADSRARDAYLRFSDVIVFDVMYKTNRYKMPFAPFTGVNHHRQSTLFGCALLADETEETFTWLFKEWLKCMWGKAPSCIITDMDGAMQNAIRTVFPNTCHRFCSWHISRHLVEHIPAMRDSTSDFAKDYTHWYFRKNIADSETEWQKLVEKYPFVENSWLGKMWELRSHWLPAYFRDTFTVGMTSSSRSESMNAFFDGFVNQGTTLQEFVEQYDNALHDRRDKESQADFKSKSTSALLISRSTLESQAAKCYTSIMFKFFKAEFGDSSDCWDELLDKNGNVSEYLVGLSNEEKWKWCKVIYEESETGSVKATCQCAKFEIEGYLCKHILRIMREKRLLSIPERYILNRWTVMARYHQSRRGVAADEGNNKAVTPLERWLLLAKCHRALDVIQNNKRLMKVDETLDACLAESELEKRDNEIVANSCSQVQSNYVTNTAEICIHDPLLVKTKGRPKKATRFKSSVEKSKSKTKQQKCGNCGQRGHYIRTCKQPKVLILAF
ncbi:protein FAR1-RELATED SEQUENCE 5-like [Tasmannia lanceolata]|uniref:protein FAR1-RELATED SEQUENCE 5-like n=1 Tax=Tasmannia lanceolata TaxID=3420 RepID=UPI004064321D